MYSQVINYIKQRVEISREEIEENLKYSDFKKFAKGDYILGAAEYCRFIGFLNKGFIVTTFVDETGNEKASELKPEGCFFTYTEGLIDNTPLHKNFIAIEDCEILVLKKEYLSVIFKTNPKPHNFTEEMMMPEKETNTLCSHSAFYPASSKRPWQVE